VREEEDEDQRGHDALGRGRDCPTSLQKCQMKVWMAGWLFFRTHFWVGVQGQISIGEVLLKDPSDGLHQPGHAQGVHRQIDEAALVEVRRNASREREESRECTKRVDLPGQEGVGRGDHAQDDVEELSVEQVDGLQVADDDVLAGGVDAVRSRRVHAHPGQHEERLQADQAQTEDHLVARTGVLGHAQDSPGRRLLELSVEDEEEPVRLQAQGGEDQRVAHGHGQPHEGAGKDVGRGVKDEQGVDVADEDAGQGEGREFPPGAANEGVIQVLDGEDEEGERQQQAGVGGEEGEHGPGIGRVEHFHRQIGARGEVGRRIRPGAVLAGLVAASVGRGPHLPSACKCATETLLCKFKLSSYEVFRKCSSISAKERSCHVTGKSVLRPHVDASISLVESGGQVARRRALIRSSGRILNFVLIQVQSFFCRPPAHFLKLGGVTRKPDRDIAHLVS